ncbi:hypothetical protein OKW49_007936 [Paraburkholderia youngii]
MAQAARDAVGKKRLKAIADRGYYSGPQIKARADARIAAILPKNLTSGARAHGRVDRADFVYIARDDEYLCPAGQQLTESAHIWKYTDLACGAGGRLSRP